MVAMRSVLAALALMPASALAQNGYSFTDAAESMVRYGVSATPTYALVDKNGLVRLYAPTRLTEADLSRRIESLLTESDPAKTP